MEKLESVLRAEDDARATVTEAHMRALTLLDEARARASAIRVDSEAEARTRAEAAQAETLENALAEAGTIAVGAHSDQVSALKRATGRVDVAVAAVMKELVG